MYFIPAKRKCINVVTDTTSNNRANFCLSPGGLPPFAGYSQSRSRPSKLRSRKNFTVDVANSCLLAAVATMRVNGAEPIFQPPTAKLVFKLGLAFFKSLSLSYLNVIQACYK